MKRIAISTIDNLHKAQVKGYTRTRKGKLERVKSYESTKTKKVGSSQFEMKVLHYQYNKGLDQKLANRAAMKWFMNRGYDYPKHWDKEFGGKLGEPFSGGFDRARIDEPSYDAWQKKQLAEEEFDEYIDRDIEESGKLGSPFSTKNLGGLWESQYAPREKALLAQLTPEAKNKWKSASLVQKIKVIDNFQAKGFFDRTPLGEPFSARAQGSVSKIGSVDVKDIVKNTHPSYRGRKIRVVTEYIPKHLDSYWNEGHRTYYTFYELGTGRMQAVGSNHPMFESGKKRYLSSLPSGVAIVARHYMGTKQALSIYVNPGDLQATTYPAGALEQTMQNFSASEHQISPLGSPFSTGTGSGSDSPDPTDEAPGWDESKRIISGGKKAKNIGPSLRKDIMKLTEKLSNKARRGGIYENFGDKEVRQLKDKYDYNSLQYGTGEERELAASIDRFSDWASIYSPHKGSSFSTQQSNTPFKDDEVRFSSRKSMEDEVLDDLVKAESKVKSHIRNVSGKIVNVREHQRYKLKGMLNFIRNYKESGVSRGSTLRKLQDRFGLSTEMAHRVHRLAEALGGALYKPFPMK